MRLPDFVLTEVLIGRRVTYPYELSITPTPSSDRIKGVTVDLNLGGEFRRFVDAEFCHAPLDLCSPTLKQNVEAYMSNPIFLEPGQQIVIAPGELLLGITEESVRIPPNLVGWLDGRSTLARVGLQVHATAHRIDPGWDGKIVLEFINAGPIPLTLTVGMHVCSISFEIVGSEMYVPMDSFGAVISEFRPAHVNNGYAANPNSKFGLQNSIRTAGG